MRNVWLWWIFQTPAPINAQTYVQPYVNQDFEGQMHQPQVQAAMVQQPLFEQQSPAPQPPPQPSQEIPNNYAPSLLGTCDVVNSYHVLSSFVSWGSNVGISLFLLISPMGLFNA